jgi:uncharacterized HAD superfamily protein
LASEQIMPLIRKTIASDPPPIDGAVESLRRLNELHNVTLVTARPADMDETTKGWLAAHGIAYGQLEHMDEGAKSLGDHVFDVVVDDHLRELLGFIGKAETLLIFDHPWNQTLNLSGHVTRVRTWPEIERIVGRLAMGHASSPGG